jgi:hypothetical protein
MSSYRTGDRFDIPDSTRLNSGVEMAVRSIKVHHLEAIAQTAEIYVFSGIIRRHSCAR